MEPAARLEGATEQLESSIQEIQAQVLALQAAGLVEPTSRQLDHDLARSFDTTDRNIKRSCGWNP
jgi:hypothetical protein